MRTLSDQIFRLFFILAVLSALFFLPMREAHSTMQGTASWYSRQSPGIKTHTASGERFNDTQLTCASWHYEFGTLLKITNVKNGKSIICRVNDRGPNKKLKRAVDLTKESFRRIGNPKHGLIKVKIVPQGKVKKKIK